MVGNVEAGAAAIIQVRSEGVYGAAVQRVVQRDVRIRQRG